MKTTLCIVTAILLSLIYCHTIRGQAQISTFLSYTNDIEKDKPAIEVEGNSFDLRTISPARSERLYLVSPVVLKEAYLDIIDGHGNAWIEHSFAVLSDVDVSLKDLAPGDYTVRIRSAQGSSEKKFINR